MAAAWQNWEEGEVGRERGEERQRERERQPEPNIRAADSTRNRATEVPTCAGQEAAHAMLQYEERRHHPSVHTEAAVEEILHWRKRCLSPRRSCTSES